MGLATARLMGKDHYIIICGRSVKKLENAVAELKAESIEIEAIACDVSPHMGSAKQIMEVNALGTININNAFYKVMGEGSCIIDVSSMSAYITPKIVMPKGLTNTVLKILNYL